MGDVQSGENLNSILGEKERKRKKISIIICFPWRGIIPFVFQSVEEGGKGKNLKGSCRLSKKHLGGIRSGLSDADTINSLRSDVVLELRGFVRSSDTWNSD